MMRIQTLAPSELEAMDCEDLLADLASSEAMAKALTAKERAVQKRLKQIEAKLEEETEGSSQDARLLDLEAELKSEKIGVGGQIQQWMAKASQVRTHLGAILKMAEKGGDLQKQIEQLVSKLLAGSDGERDAAEAEHTKAEALPERSDFPDGALGEQKFKDATDVQIHRVTIMGPAAPASHYATVLHSVKMKHGERIARLLQSQFWATSRIPAGMGYL